YLCIGRWKTCADQHRKATAHQSTKHERLPLNVVKRFAARTATTKDPRRERSAKREVRCNLRCSFLRISKIYTFMWCFRIAESVERLCVVL
ncbi:MAG: hypothetical protein KDF57_18955, partial [Ottowia sp.]|nr:hypothetical protein [Ottowia sp.]